jgi:transcriptional regulator with XRE-family HTH domain
MAKRKPRPITPEDLDAAEALAARALEELDDEPGLAELISPQADEDGSPFYFVLRNFVQQLKNARLQAGLKLSDVEARSQIAVESLSRLETGTNTNPTWKTLGGYAKAVGCRPVLTAAPLLQEPPAPLADVAPATNTVSCVEIVAAFPGTPSWILPENGLPFHGKAMVYSGMEG